MPNNNEFNLFALLDENVPIRHIPITDKCQQELRKVFLEQPQEFTGGKKIIEFTGDGNANRRILRIKKYSLPTSISDALVMADPLNLPKLNLKTEANLIKALFTGKRTKQGNIIINFRVFDVSKLLSNKDLILTNSGNAYKKFEKIGLVLGNKPTAYFSDNEKLLFSSYRDTKKFLNLSSYYTTITDGNLTVFGEKKFIKIENPDIFMKNADTTIRRKVSLLLQNEKFDELFVKSIKKIANKIDKKISDEDNEIRIQIKRGQIVIPEEKKRLKNLLSFLCGEYVTESLSDKICLTNSKTYM